MKIASFILTLIAVCFALIHIRAEYLGPTYQIYIFKPLTMICIILIAVLNARRKLALYGIMIIAGLLCSLVGDIFLMLPAELFIAGLISFLVAHLFYIVAFIYGRPFQFSFWYLLPFLVYGVFIFIGLAPTLGKLKIPVLAYIIIILIMGWQAGERWRQLRHYTALLAFIGALLFIISDTVLAYNKFYEHLEFGRALNLGTYFLAQGLIAWSVRTRKVEVV